MALKRKSKIDASFSMASMTDIIFLLLIFFLITSTIVVPNSIKVTLPEAQKQTAAKPYSRVTIDANLNYYVAYGTQRDRRVSFNEIESFLQEQHAKEPEMWVSIFADETIPYKEVVRVMEIANKNKFKMTLATRVSR
ncbi:MAG: biopolymer transporter ExbD [Tannerella sp.]|jgi:biopolymer transport protein ExbD|nr:biopolymer transporter ExbD [Tannerella sp.]